ncbi:hypothetical protein SNE40_014191 [Patella caerulea]|uniref:Uncharacterized protein n=1 Tax=Patella caerulea TaxID=87958 RepID=A0AAN8JDG4_PATCE
MHLFCSKYELYSKVGCNFYLFVGPKEEALKVYGYHSKCYSRFCAKQRIQSSEKRTKRAAPETRPHSPSTPSQKRRSHRPLSCTVTSSTGGVLPSVCIICKKVDPYIKHGGKRTKDLLYKTPTLDAVK